MKILLSVLFLTFCIQVQAQEELLLNKVWRLFSSDMDGVSEPVADDEVLTIEFFKDGTFSVFELDESYNGEWQYNQESMELWTNDVDGLGMHKILKLTADRLIYKDVHGSTEFIMYYKVE